MMSNALLLAFIAAILVGLIGAQVAIRIFVTCVTSIAGIAVLGLCFIWYVTGV